MKQFRLYILIGISYFLVACENSPSSKAITEAEKVIPKDIVQRSTQYIRIAEIESAYLIDKNIDLRNQSLLKLADIFKSEDNCNAAEIIVKHTQASLQNNAELAYANLIKAECVLASLSDISDFTNKQPLLDLINHSLDQVKQTIVDRSNTTIIDPQEFFIRTQLADAKLYAEQGKFFSALETLLSSTNLVNFLPQPEYSNTIWKWFSLVDKDKRATLTARHSLLQDYKTLLDTIEDSTINDRSRRAAINQWLQANVFSELAINLPQQVQNYLAISNQQSTNIGVLLPLSGRLSGQGEVIKQGILSAYYERLTGTTISDSKQVSLEFIDTGSLSTIKETVNLESLVNFDTIIGPLLRSHILEVNALNLPAKQQLLLNQTEEIIVSENALIASFSLSPEQEAEQLVALMRKRNITSPVVINDGSSIFKRMNNAFIAAWEASKLTDTEAHSLQQIEYTDNKNMRVGITAALDVLQSKKRIQQLSNIAPERVYSVTRNRRDIDAFVVFARPNDLELINPIIETSISLFTNEQIPVFASSYSYDHKQSKNTQRDLRNLVFVDMPWLLPEGRKQAISANVDTLFNYPPSAFLRLFAFGYDSLALVDNLAQLSTFAHLSINGLSGVLSINKSHKLNRELSSLTITSN